MKIAVIGGGSTYTPELVDGFARLRGEAGLDVDELVLVDPAADRLAVVGPFSARIFGHHGNPGRVTWTSTVDEGLAGADVVVIQLRVGGQTARISDETFPLDCGCVGQETTGAGGLAKALRTVPVVLDIAARAARLASPDAWIDRKSTRLNSSHLVISYAVFCLKKTETKAHADDLLRFVGPDNVYFEVHKNVVPQQDKANEGIARIAQDVSRPLVTTHDAHYLRR